MTNLEKIIIERGIKKGWLAKQAGVAAGTLSKIISGESIPNLKTALKIAKALGLSVENIWGEIIEENEENR